MGKIEAICLSMARGTQKTPRQSVRVVADWGLDGDAHAGHWHRQVSLLGQADIDAFRRRGADVQYGDFGENLVIYGIDIGTLPGGTLLESGDVLLETTQIGKACHNHCAIYQTVGDCIMPRKGIFARVLKGGTLTVGDEIHIKARVGKRPYQAAVITLSDKGSRGEREDTSGPALVAGLKSAGYEVVEQILLPDDKMRLEAELRRLCDQRQLDLIVTTGGTGFSPRDVTPEATLAVATRNAPGIAEMIRAESYKITKRAMLSRAASVIRGKTLIINFPGSRKACIECLDICLDVLRHGLDVLRGDNGDCGR